MTPQDVNIVDFSGTSLDWLRAALLVQIAFDVATLVVLVVIAVRLMWGRP